MPRYYTHPQVKGQLFAPPRRTNPDVAADDVVEPEEAADVLGTSPKTVRDLADAGHLRLANPDDTADDSIDGGSIRSFLKRLRPSAPPATSPDSSPALVTAEDAGDEGDDEGAAEPETFTAKCPNCRTPLTVGAGVMAVKCPGCGKRLEISTPPSAPPKPPRASNPGFLGMRWGEKARARDG